MGVKSSVYNGTQWDTMGMSIEGKAMVGFIKRTWKTMCDEILGIQIPIENKIVLDGQRIQIKVHIDWIAQPLSFDANELQVHQCAHCYVLSLLGDMVFVDKSGDRVHLMWLEFMENLHNPTKYSWGSAALSWLYRQLCKATEKTAKKFGGVLILVQLWIYNRRNPQFHPYISTRFPLWSITFFPTAFSSYPGKSVSFLSLALHQRWKMHTWQTKYTVGTLKVDMTIKIIIIKCYLALKMPHQHLN